MEINFVIGGGLSLMFQWIAYIWFAKSEKDSKCDSWNIVFSSIISFFLIIVFSIGVQIVFKVSS